MRPMWILVVAGVVIGCGKIDSSRSDSMVDSQAPKISMPDDAARAPATAADSTAQPAQAEPDNTAVNARDADRVTREPKLPIDQNETQTDVDMTAKIRQRVIGAEGLSINARNVKIITADGQVTLRGPVNSAAEHGTIVQIARELAGTDNVDDQLEVKTSEPPNTTTPNP
jgi:hyperosmotically inducible periplasmic protein